MCGVCTCGGLAFRTFDSAETRVQRVRSQFVVMCFEVMGRSGLLAFALCSVSYLFRSSNPFSTRVPHSWPLISFSCDANQGEFTQGEFTPLLLSAGGTGSAVWLV